MGILKDCGFDNRVQTYKSQPMKRNTLFLYPVYPNFWEM
jgi:hypothetical protein